MAEKSAMSQRKFRELWRRAPISDRKFISTMIVVAEGLGLKRLRYGLLPPRIERYLTQCDRKTLFSILAECVGLLANAPAMRRLKQSHRDRHVQRRTEKR